MSHDDTLRDAAADHRHDTAHTYEQSDDFITDALTWVADHGIDNAAVCAVAMASYRESPQYDTKIDDLLFEQAR